MPLSDEELYSRLEAVVKSQIPKGVTYFTRLQPDEIEAGWFSPAPNGQPPPLIVVYRPSHQDVPGDVLQELLTLAHEFGHFRSFGKDLRTAAYEAAIEVPHAEWPTLDTRSRNAILQEEMRAWQLGREALEGIGFTDWGAFDTRQRESLAGYRSRLEI
jgi:hypothetical protein